MSALEAHYWAEGPSGSGTSLEELLDLLERRPAFWTGAACRSAPPVLTWFPVRGDNEAVDAAVAVCAGCPVVDACREWASAQGGELAGIWGGLSSRQRRARRWPRRDTHVTREAQ